MVRISSILKVLGYSVLFVISFFLALSPFVDIIGKNLQAHTWVGIFCGILSSFILYFSSVADFLKDKISSIEAKLTEDNNKLAEIENQCSIIAQKRKQFSHAELNAAIRFTFAEVPVITNLRIYASTSEVIFNTIRDIDKKIVDCKVLLQTFNSQGFTISPEKMNDRVKSMLEAWTEHKTSGKIEKLDVVFYNRYPSEYIIIVNEKFSICGKYSPDDKSTFGSMYSSAIIFDNSENAAHKLINQQIEWFDIHYDYFVKHRDEIKI